MTIVEFGRALRAGRVTAEAAARDLLDRIAAENAALNAFILVMADRAMQDARSADRELAAGHDRGPLHGVPISVKDLIDIGGVPTTAASLVADGRPAGRDAAALANLRRAGAVFLGKTNLHEFALGTTNEESAFGPARNPHDRTRSPGGSSGGSAASVAAGLSLASIGSDTGGSIRIPAAACGIVGLKPTSGEVSVEGVIPLSRTLDHVGPLAGTVADTALVYRGLLGLQSERPVAALPVAGLRLGVLRPYFCELLDDDVRSRFEEALARLREAGAHESEVEIPHARDIAGVYTPIVLAEAAAYHAGTLESRPEKYTPPVRQRLEAGQAVAPAEYRRALQRRERLWLEVNAALDGLDALVLPTLPIPAPPLGAADVPIGDRREPIRSLMLRLTQLFDITGHPAISIPCGRTAAGLPVGFQMVGSRMQTEALMAAALACEPYLQGAEVPR
jgi:aspartyl-tRNA(Asn)/glutamyl-tRNA(Gln) amidotransferase subunit A